MRFMKTLVVMMMLLMAVCACEAKEVELTGTAYDKDVIATVPAGYVAGNMKCTYYDEWVVSDVMGKYGFTNIPTLTYNDLEEMLR